MAPVFGLLSSCSEQFGENFQVLHKTWVVVLRLYVVLSLYVSLLVDHRPHVDPNCRCNAATSLAAHHARYRPALTSTVVTRR